MPKISLMTSEIAKQRGAIGDKFRKEMEKLMESVPWSMGALSAKYAQEVRRRMAELITELLLVGS